MRDVFSCVFFEKLGDETVQGPPRGGDAVQNHGTLGVAFERLLDCSHLACDPANPSEQSSLLFVQMTHSIPR